MDIQEVEKLLDKMPGGGAYALKKPGRKVRAYLEEHGFDVVSSTIRDDEFACRWSELIICDGDEFRHVSYCWG